MAEVKEELAGIKANLTATQTAASELENQLQESEKEKKRLSLRLQYRKSQKTSKYLDHGAYNKELTYLQSMMKSLQKN